MPAALSDDDRLAIGQRLRDRQHVTRLIEEAEQYRLLLLERALITQPLGSDLMYPFVTTPAELTPDDLMFGWFAIVSELIDKTAATHTRVVESLQPVPQQQTSQKRWFGLQRRRYQPPQPVAKVERVNAPEFLFPYTRAAGIESRYEGRDDDLLRLHTLRRRLESALGMPENPESGWTRFKIPPEPHAIYDMIKERIDVRLRREGSDVKYDDLRRRTEYGNFEYADTLARVLRYAVDDALAELRLDIVEAELKGKSLRRQR